jgi:hypothetical protein
MEIQNDSLHALIFLSHGSIIARFATLGQLDGLYTPVVRV